MLTQVFITTSCYALSHQLGMLEAIQRVNEQIRNPTSESLPAVRTLTRIHKLTTEASPDGGIGYLVDGGATLLAMARSRHFHEALKSSLPAWISIDDDVEATTPLCAAMLEALDDVAPRVLVVPCMVRAPTTHADGVPSVAPRLACTLPAIFEERTRRFEVGGQSRLCRMVKMPKGGAFGMVGMNRAAMQAIAEHAPPSLRFLDGDGAEKLALFHEILRDGLWYGEDMSFFQRVPEAVSVEALLAGVVVHAGIPLDLDKLGEVPGATP